MCLKTISLLPLSILLSVLSLNAFAAEIHSGYHEPLVCTSCHLTDPGNDAQNVDLITNEAGQLCLNCHEVFSLREYTNSPTKVNHASIFSLPQDMLSFYQNWLAAYNTENGTSLNGFDFNIAPNGTASLSCIDCHQIRGGSLYPDIPMTNGEMCISCHGGFVNFDPDVTQGVKSSAPRILYNPQHLGATDEFGMQYLPPSDINYAGQPPADGDTVSGTIPLPISFFRKFHGNVIEDLEHQITFTTTSSSLTYLGDVQRPMSWYTGLNEVPRWPEEMMMFQWQTDTFDSGDYLVEFLPINKDQEAAETAMPYVMQLTVKNQLTAIELIQKLINLVESSDLQFGIEKSLDVKLQSAKGALEDINLNNNQSAINRLNAFINACLAQRGGELPETLADDLIDLAMQASEAIEMESSQP